MNLPKLTENLNIHQSLPDKPTLTTEELKKEFDKASNIIKHFLNDILINELQTQLESELSTMSKNLKTSITNQRPVGSLYISTTNEDPNQLWEGTTWKKIEDVFLLASGKRTLGERGGSETVTLGIENIPSHNHTYEKISAVTSNNYDRTYAGQGVEALSRSIDYTSSSGNGKPFSIIPTNLVVNVWERIA